MKLHSKKVLVLLLFLGIFGMSGSFVAHGATMNVTPPSKLTNGLVGWWTMDGPNMLTNVKDSSGQGNNGNMVNFAATSTVVVPGKVGQGLTFDGVNDNVVMTQFGGFPTTATETSVSFWAKPKNTGNTILLSFGLPNINRFLIHLPYAGMVYWDFGDIYNGGRLSTSWNNSWYDVWAQYTFTAKNGVGMFIYRNGIQIASLNNSTNSVTLGSSVPTIAPSLWGGSLDDFRIYNRALSATEVQQLYNSTSATKQAASPQVTNTSCTAGALSCGLVGYWSFDGSDMSAGVARDKSGSGRNGNPVNIATSTFYVPGKIGQAFNFDGVNNYVKLNSALTTSGAFTTSLWIKPKVLGISGGFMMGGGNANGQFFISNASTIEVRDTGGLTDVTLTTSLQINKWQHLVVTRDASNNLLVYLNGVNVTSGSPTFTFTKNWDYIGSRSDRNNLFKGSLDDVRIYNRALTATEVTQLYNLGR